MHDPDDRNEALAREVGRELRKPVTLSPDLEQRVMAQIRARLGEAGSGRSYVGRARGRRRVGGPGVWDRNPHRDARRAGRAARRVSAGGAQRIARHSGGRLQQPGSLRHPTHPLSPGALGGHCAARAWSVSVHIHLVDGSHWVADPHLPAAAGDDFGEPTSVITIIPSARL